MIYKELVDKSIRKQYEDEFRRVQEKYGKYKEKDYNNPEWIILTGEQDREMYLYMLKRINNINRFKKYDLYYKLLIRSIDDTLN